MIEKNWTPLIKDDKLYLIYMFDPMIVVRYDFNSEGICELIYKQEGTVFPIIGNCYLRGGSPLIPLGDGHYFGLCHSRIVSSHTNVGGYAYPYYLPHMIVVDTNAWKVIYLSNPLQFEYDKNRTDIKTIAGTNVIFDEGPWMATLSPNSICKYDAVDGDGYLVMGTVNDSRCLKFKLQSNAMLYDNTMHEIGYWNNMAKMTTIAVVQHVSKHQSTYY
jgi:hypothetical protein